MIKWLLIIGLVSVSACRTIPTKADCTDIRCMPEEHNPNYWRF